ncbi:MAG: TetR/AcrR family transcriptional regulator [bacterium]|nr:TetR/AcrR family transcriptional regulator [bacterium]
MRTPDEDLRVKRTEKSLRNALISLILKKGYDAITVQDIVDEAETSRVTFYRHYKDKAELLTACLDVVYQDLVAHMSPCSLIDFHSDPPPVLILYKYLEENLDLYRAILNSEGSVMVQKRIRDYLVYVVQREIVEAFPLHKMPIPVQLVSLHIAVAELGMLLWWLDNPTAYSAEYMAKVSHTLNFGGVLEGMGVKLPALS